VLCLISFKSSSRSLDAGATEPVIIRNGISRSLCDGICRRYSGILPPMPRLYCQLKRLGVKHFRIQTSFAGLGICRRNSRDIPAGICGRPVGISRRGPQPQPRRNSMTLHWLRAPCRAHPPGISRSDDYGRSRGLRTPRPPRLSTCV
jgi:hypothetical protein